MLPCPTESFLAGHARHHTPVTCKMRRPCLILVFDLLAVREGAQQGVPLPEATAIISE